MVDDGVYICNSIKIYRSCSGIRSFVSDMHIMYQINAAYFLIFTSEHYFKNKLNLIQFYRRLFVGGNGISDLSFVKIFYLTNTNTWYWLTTPL